MLVYAAAAADTELPFATVAAHLNELGWRYSDSRRLEASALHRLPVWVVLSNVTDQPVTWKRQDIVTPTAAALARRALRSPR